MGRNSGTAASAAPAATQPGRFASSPEPNARRIQNRLDHTSDLADRVHLLVDHIRRHVPALEEIAVKPPEVALDLSFFWISSIRSTAAA
jgi:hypothetical protein